MHARDRMPNLSRGGRPYGVIENVRHPRRLPPARSRPTSSSSCSRCRLAGRLLQGPLGDGLETGNHPALLRGRGFSAWGQDLFRSATSLGSLSFDGTLIDLRPGSLAAAPRAAVPRWIRIDHHFGHWDIWAWSTRGGVLMSLQFIGDAGVYLRSETPSRYRHCRRQRNRLLCDALGTRCLGLWRVR